MTSRELVHATLEFRNTEGRVPRDLWTLPWANQNYPNELKKNHRGLSSGLWRSCGKVCTAFPAGIRRSL